jgi:UDP-4-amino-4,6-dideoxy-N-acetyl-beta-L-altrosamine N-acetyltransferase
MIDLRDLKPDDAGQLYAWRREPDVSRWMSNHPPATPQVHQRWFDRLLADPDRKGWIVTRHGRPAGFLALTGLTGICKRAEWGWYIGDPDARGRGVGRAAQALGLDRAFDEFGLEKVWAEVLADNDAALKAQAAAGFRREGYLRNHALKDGVFRDVALLAILAEEWRERRAAVRKSLTESHLIAA